MSVSVSCLDTLEETNTSLRAARPSTNTARCATPSTRPVAPSTSGCTTQPAQLPVVSVVSVSVSVSVCLCVCVCVCVLHHISSSHPSSLTSRPPPTRCFNAKPPHDSLCGWNSWYAPVGWSLGNSWRIAGDVNRWDSVYNAIRTNENLYNYSRPGGWNE